jgi:hypothetical protein
MKTEKAKIIEKYNRDLHNAKVDLFKDDVIHFVTKSKDKSRVIMVWNTLLEWEQCKLNIAYEKAKFAYQQAIGNVS